MFLGRFTQGQFALLELLTVNGSGVASAPTATPVIKVYNSSGTALLTTFMPPLDKNNATGLFSYPLRLGSSYSVGTYNVAFNYTVGGSTFLQVGSFEVVAGGDADGTIISQHHFERPGSAHLVQRLDSDQRVLGREPGV